MTPQETREQAVKLAVQREQASQDLGDIGALEKYEPFNRYWVRRLNDMFAARVFESRKAATPELREKARIEANMLEELTQIPARDKQACMGILSADPQATPKPRQVA